MDDQRPRARPDTRQASHPGRGPSRSAAAAAARADDAPALPVAAIRALRRLGEPAGGRQLHLRGAERRGRRTRLTLAQGLRTTAWADDRAALRAACEPGVGLCTIVGIEGSFSRRLGAQLAVGPDGAITGSLADGCLEKQLASEIAAATGPAVKRFGAGSELIDFRLPCGSGLDVLIDPEPERAACRAAVEKLDAREAATLALPSEQLPERCYIPALALQLFGEGPELEALVALARAAGIEASA